MPATEGPAYSFREAVSSILTWSSTDNIRSRRLSPAV